MISSHAVMDLEIWEGATFYREFAWKIGTPPVAVDLTGHTAALQARDAHDSEIVVLDLTTGSYSSVPKLTVGMRSPFRRHSQRAFAPTMRNARWFMTSSSMPRQEQMMPDCSKKGRSLLTTPSRGRANHE